MNEYPLHWCVFENDVESLKQQLSRVTRNEIDQKDLRNKTPLELAIFLDHFECAKLLAEHGADCSHITKYGWNLVQESVSTGNAELIKLIMSHRDYQRSTARANGIPELLNKLKQASDFYVEMKWEFTSWIPLISKACPSDVYKVYKSGSNVRIDTTLIGFNGTTWERGNRSYIFQASTDGSGSATIIEVDHLQRTYHIDKINTIDPLDTEDLTSGLYEPDDQIVQNKLLSPNMVTFLDIEKIEFERNRSGLWGWRTDKNDTINGYDCRVYTANNLQLVTKTRVEHLNSERAREFLREQEENDLQNQMKQSNSNLPGFLGNFFQGSVQKIQIEKSLKKLTALEYFQKAVNVDYYLNGTVRSIDETRKIQTFNATLSLCDGYPLSLREQVSPIVDLMALNNSHFKKLKEFITLQLPSGFPVRVEIPLYRVITAKVTFGNIHALDNHVEHVTTIKNNNNNITPPRLQSTENDLTSQQRFLNDSDSTFLLDEDETSSEAVASKILPNKMVAKMSSNSSSTCIVDERVFKIPSNYRCTNQYMPSGIDSNFIYDTNRNSNNGNASHGDNRRLNYGQSVDDDEIILQLAIQQSLAMVSNNVNTNNNNNIGAESEDQSIALDFARHRTTGGTQSLDEYHERRNNLLILNNTEEDLILQRVLAESLLTSNLPNTTATPQENQTFIDLNTRNLNANEPADDDLLKIIELSKKEEEERAKRIRDEEEELRKILELSLLEK